MIRALRRFMAGDEPGLTAASRCEGAELSVFRHHRRRFEHVSLLIQLFYVLQLFHVQRALRGWAERLDDDHAILLWPASWLGGLDFPHLVSVVISLFAGGVIAAMIFPRRRWARTLAFVGMLFYGALENSFGKIDHGLHAWLLIGFLFIVLPDGPVRSRARRHQVLTLFVAAQAGLLTCYSLAGFWKLLAGIEQAWHGQIGWLSPSAFAYLTANRLGQTASETILGPLVIEMIWLGGPLIYGALYMELLSLAVTFRPSVHRIWGLSIICLHLGSILILDIGFLGNMLLAGTFLVAAPDVVGEMSFLRRLGQMPLVAAARRLKARLRSPAP